MIIERGWAVGKLGSLDLSTKKAILDRKEGNQAIEIKNTPSLNNKLNMLKQNLVQILTLNYYMQLT